jgi:hypothetical protein
MGSAMPRWPLIALAAVTACTDWRSLYRGRDAAPVLPKLEPPDAAGDGEETADAEAAPPADVHRSGAGDAPACNEPPSGPVVVWKFEGRGQPDPMQFVPDSACRDPEVSLSWDLLRDPGKTTMADRVLYLDGGFLLADKGDSDDLGRAITRARSFTIELWLRARRLVNGTIFTTNGDRDPGRAFGIVQKDSELRFAVHTTATDPNGLKFTGAASTVTAEVSAPLPVDTAVPVHVVCMYSSGDREASVYINGIRAAAVAHLLLGPLEPVPVWASGGKNQLGVGASFDGTPWHGWLHRVAVYDRALAPNEIAELARQIP